MPKVCPSCELTYSDEDFFCAVDGSPLRSTGAEADNLVGTVIADRYRVDSILGEGGMGRVYRARHVRVPREAAIKVLRRALIADSYAVAAFNREARNAASVGDHPNVAAVYDFGETSDGLVFLAMEFVEGETLTRRLEREPVLPASRAVEIVRQVAAGLTAAHDLPEPVVHRDLKPDNILLKTTRDGSDWVKIVDFGIAKAAKRDTQLLTTPGLVVGTPRYMSPEQLTGAPIDARSDIYALAIIAFQMLTGRMPFPSTSREEELTIPWALQRLTTSPLRLDQVKPDVPWPDAAHDVVARALATNPADRPPTAVAFAQSLARAFGFSTPSSVIGVVADVPGPISSAVQAAARAAAPTAPLTAPPAPLPAATPAASRPAAGASAAGGSFPGPTASEGAGRRSRALGIGIGALVVVAAAFGIWQLVDTPTSGTAGPGVDSALGPPPTTYAQRQPVRDTGESVNPQVSAPSVAPPAASVNPPAASATPNDPPARSAPPKRAIDARPDPRRVRASLDAIKAAVADPDALGVGGRGDQVLRDVGRLLPTLTSARDSVEATYYAVEANLALDRPTEACRLMVRVRDKARGTPFERGIEVFLADADLRCANR